jgi:hypothetical protein
MQQSSAEEGGDFPLDLQPDGTALTLYLDESIGAFAGADTRRRASRIKLGRDDRIFRLHRTDAVQCGELERLGR